MSTLPQQKTNIFDRLFGIVKDAANRQMKQVDLPPVKVEPSPGLLAVLGLLILAIFSKK